MEIKGGNPGVTWLWLVLDTSGSMGGAWEGVQAGVNAMLKEQAENGHDEVFVGVTLFDYEARVRNPVPIEDFPSRLSFQGGGSTALFEAVGKTIQAAESLIAKLPPEQRPGRVIFMAQTDGGENGSSSEWSQRNSANWYGPTAPKLKRLVAQKEKEGWEFVYVGLDHGAEQGPVMGIARRAVYLKKSPEEMVHFLSGLSVALRCGHNVPKKLLSIDHFK